MTPSKLILVGGGVRSGKSRFALELALRHGSHPTFVATARAEDDEMRLRTLAHQRERGDRFRTVEEPLDLAGVLLRPPQPEVVVIDCLTLWLSNLLLDDAEDTESRIDAFEGALRGRAGHIIVVSNEVGMGVVPPTPLGRAFRDLVGTTHQRLSAIADELYLAVLGTVVQLRPTLTEVRP